VGEKEAAVLRGALTGIATVKSLLSRYVESNPESATKLAPIITRLDDDADIVDEYWGEELRSIVLNAEE